MKTNKLLVLSAIFVLALSLGSILVSAQRQQGPACYGGSMWSGFASCSHLQYLTMNDAKNMADSYCQGWGWSQCYGYYTNNECDMEGDQCHCTAIYNGHCQMFW